MKIFEVVHLTALASLFVLGIVVLFLATRWFAFNWVGSCALTIVGMSNLGLSLSGRRFEGVVAATVISSFWTIAAAVVFSNDKFVLESWLLLSSSVLQVICALFSFTKWSSPPELDPEGFLPPHYFSQANNHHPPASYGALSLFVDPLSMSSQQASPSSSPSSAKKVPSPFGSVKFSSNQSTHSAAGLQIDSPSATGV